MVFVLLGSFESVEAGLLYVLIYALMWVAILSDLFSDPPSLLFSTLILYQSVLKEYIRTVHSI